MKSCKFVIGLAVLMGISLFTAGLAMAVEVGQVISLKPGVTAQRNGQKVALKMSSRVHDTDTLITDATGRVQILFDDDSTVSLSSNSNLSLLSVVPSGGNEEFKAHLGHGLARFITGKIVENNPDGFTLTAPEATIGIRGTIFAVESLDSRTTTVYIFSAETHGQLGDVMVNSMPIAGGFKITVPGGQPQQMSNDEWNGVTNLTQARSGAAATETAEAEPEAAATETAQAETTESGTAQSETMVASAAGTESPGAAVNAPQPETKTQTVADLAEQAQQPATPSQPAPEQPGDPDPGLPGQPDPGLPDPEVPTPEVPGPGDPDPGLPDPELPTPEVPGPGDPDPGLPEPGVPDPELPVLPTPNFNAHVSGSMSSILLDYGLVDGGSQFGFDINLDPNDGQVSNATMQQYLTEFGSGTVKYDYNLINGSGVASNGSVDISGFERRPNTTFKLDGINMDPSGAYINMHVDGLNSGHAENVSGYYEVMGGSSFTGRGDSGSLDGIINMEDPSVVIP
ncbi:hypothetical protein C4J81_12635 [Deltaproteobacteria bacterium Smac51]|nr:hypothetical protein C4J81_12635 [Deltaproteobacteria bacterium Smac51]